MKTKPNPIRFAFAAVSITLAIPTVSFARTSDVRSVTGAGSGEELPPYLQCVPYAREVSGIDIYGDAHTWWEQAESRFARGETPRVGAVMAFVPHGGMQLGHVAAVSRVIDARTVLLDHANWSPINGRRGQIERGVKAIDVSPGNDWSEVRVWYDPMQGLGTTHWPVHGFIYPDATKQSPTRRFAAARPSARPQPTRDEPSRAFLSAFTQMPSSQLAPAAPAQPRIVARPRVAYVEARELAPRQQTGRQVRQPAAQRGGGDPTARALALYD